MKRIRNLGLAALMALALTASVGAASASASGFVAEADPAPLEVDSSLVSLEFGGVPFICDGIEFDLDELMAPALSLETYSPEDASCEYYSGGFKSTLKWGNCKLIFHPGEEAAWAEHFNGTFDIGPAGCGPVVFDVSEISGWCDSTIPSQTGILAEFNNVTEKGGKEFMEIRPVAGFEREPKGKGCGSNGSLTVTWKVTATDADGNPTGVHVDETGLYLAGKESESESEKPRFDAEAFPLSVVGVQNAASPHLFTRQGRTFTCSTVDVQQLALSGASSELTLDADYEGCTFTAYGETWPATIDMNGCSYVLHALNTGPPYTGQASVACPGGSAIELNGYPGKVQCTYEITPQESLKSVGYSTIGEGSARAIDVDLNLEAVNAKRVEGTLVLCGSIEKTLTYTGGATLFGVR